MPPSFIDPPLCPAPLLPLGADAAFAREPAQPNGVRCRGRILDRRWKRECFHIYRSRRLALMTTWGVTFMKILRTILRAALVVFVSTVANISIGIADDAPITIVVWGGGYVMGRGLPAEDKFPVRLEAALKASGHSVRVETVFTETTKDGLKWLKRTPGQALLTQSADHAVIIELGEEDCNSDYSHQSLLHTRTNLDQILAQLAEKQIPVLVVGTTAPASTCASAYIVAYAPIFPNLARKYGDLLYPSFLGELS